jgi:hypothetical protein
MLHVGSGFEGLRVYLGFFLWAVLFVPVYVGAPYAFFFIKFITYQKKKSIIVMHLLFLFILLCAALYEWFIYLVIGGLSLLLMIFLEPHGSTC